MSLCSQNIFYMYMDIFLKSKVNYIFYKHSIINRTLSFLDEQESSVCIHTLITVKGVCLGTTKENNAFSLSIKWEYTVILKLSPSILLLSCHISLFHLCQCVLLHLICCPIFLMVVSLALLPQKMLGVHVSLLFSIKKAVSAFFHLEWLKLLGLWVFFSAGVGVYWVLQYFPLCKKIRGKF